MAPRSTLSAVSWPLAASLLALCSCGRTESYNRVTPCVRQPEGVSGLKVQKANGMPRLWNREACVPVTYAPSLEKFKPTLQAAFDAWDLVECTGLCFEPMKPNKETPKLDNDLRLHAADTGSAPGSAWEMLNDGRTGQTLHATIYVNSRATVGDVLRQLGYVLGFEASSQMRDSVVEEKATPSPRTALGAIDRQSVCAVYPPCR